MPVGRGLVNNLINGEKYDIHSKYVMISFPGQMENGGKPIGTIATFQD